MADNSAPVANAQRLMLQGLPLRLIQDGLVDESGNPLSVGFATPHVSYRMPNGNFMIAMGGAWVPERPDLNLKAPGGFIEMSPNGDVVRAFPKFEYENVMFGRMTSA